MWQDAQGHVRVGLLHLLPTAQAASSLAFRVGGLAASGELVEAEWQKVADYQRPGRKGKGNTGQKYLTRVRLTDEGLQEAFARDLARAMTACRLRYGGQTFDRFPGGAQLALLDLELFGPAVDFEHAVFEHTVECLDWEGCALLVPVSVGRVRAKDLERLFRGSRSIQTPALAVAAL
jgi:hypothetical protein